VRRLMQLTGGRVAAHSIGVGQGARFDLFWPAAPRSSG
jgi:signal transduction histidine kinase